MMYLKDIREVATIPIQYFLTYVQYMKDVEKCKEIKFISRTFTAKKNQFNRTKNLATYEHNSVRFTLSFEWHCVEML